MLTLAVASDQMVELTAALSTSIPPTWTTIVGAPLHWSPRARTINDVAFVVKLAPFVVAEALPLNLSALPALAAESLTTVTVPSVGRTARVRLERQYGRRARVAVTQQERACDTGQHDDRERAVPSSPPCGAVLTRVRHGDPPSRDRSGAQPHLLGCVLLVR
jgi:hypothetical protein